MGRKVTAKGMHDLLPEDLEKVEYIESLFLRAAKGYGFIRVQTPILELAETYRSTSEFPEEKCYSLVDGGARELILRSDPDAPLARIVANYFRHFPRPIKLAFCGSIFRAWNPRRREFRMFSIDTFGIDEPTADAEILRVIADVMDEVGFSGYRVEFNNLQLFRHIIKATSSKPLGHSEVGSILHAIRFAPDRKSASRTNLPHGLSQNTVDVVLSLLECGDDESRTYDTLIELGGEIPSLIPETEKTFAFREALRDHDLQNTHFNVSNLHGTGFYSGFTYRLSPLSGSKEIGDGGRYDEMVDRMGGGPVPATGIGLGIERFIELMEADGYPVILPPKVQSIVIAYDKPSLATRCRSTVGRVRLAGRIVEEDLTNRGFDKTVRYAKSKSYNRAVMIKTPEPRGGFYVKIVNLDEGRVDLLAVRNLEDLFSILLAC